MSFKLAPSLLASVAVGGEVNVPIEDETDKYSKYVENLKDITLSKLIKQKNILEH